MPIVPHTFSDDYESQIILGKERFLTKATWPILKLSVLHKPLKTYESVTPEICCKNTESFFIHGNYGYSLQKFSEFFVYYDEWERGLHHIDGKIGHAEFTLGDITPLGLYLFSGLHNSDFHPELDHIFSVRLLGVQKDKVEAYLINAFIELQKKYGENFKLFAFNQYSFPGPFSEETPSIQLSSVFTDIEPLRFIYEALRNSDDAYAFLQFYRVIEYYSVMSLSKQASVYRTKKSLDAINFFKQVSRLITRSEKNEIINMIEKITDNEILNKAINMELLTKGSNRHALGEKIYSFRNSMVHAKYDMQTSIQTESIFNSSVEISKWRIIAQDLAMKSLKVVGNHDLRKTHLKKH